MKKLIVVVALLVFFFGQRSCRQIGAGVDSLYQSAGLEKKVRR